MSQIDRDNEVRFSPERAGRGHVESHFLKATSPDGLRAFWVKHTILAKRGRPDDAVAEVWAIAFDKRGGSSRVVAGKLTEPAAQARFQTAPFASEIGDARLDSTTARGEVGGGTQRVRWDVSWVAHASPYHFYPSEAFYAAPLPKSKTLTPTPDATFTGHLDVGGERWDVAGWAGMQGHNWGTAHHWVYAWAQCNDFVGRVRGAWFEGGSGRVRLGPVTTPWLSLAALHVDGRTYAFGGAGALFTRKVEVSLFRWRFTVAAGATSLEGEVTAEREDLAGLRYENPEGPETHCLNSKLARGSLTLRRPGEPPLVLESDRFALELGLKDTTHGVELRA